MAELAASGSGFTLLDFAKRTDPTGSQQVIAELLQQNNPILEDIVYKEGNLSTGEQVAIRTGLPAVYWRKYNQRTPHSSSTTAQNTFPFKTLKASSMNDAELMELGGDVDQARLNELVAHIEAMNQEFAETYFYGDASSDESEFSGLATTYSSHSTGESAVNVINGGGSGSNNASIYLVGHGINKVYCAFPKGSVAGLQHVDKGKITDNNDSGTLDVYQDLISWKATLVVKDWRYCVRICNIDVPDLSGGLAADLPDLMIEATSLLPNLEGACFYMNRTLQNYLVRQARNDVQSGGGLTFENVGGKKIATFMGIPVKRVDALLSTEAAVS